MIVLITKELSELTVEEAKTLCAMGFDVECNNGQVTNVSREVNA